MQPDLWHLYEQMLTSRRFEGAVTKLWREGKISGEMHLSVGEEAIVAGVVDHLRDGDAMALDHRGTAPLLMRGIDPLLLLREFLGQSDGLCAGMGGHMHLFSPLHMAASSGIVGASGPAAAGFALAAQLLRPEAVAVAFFGEGAANQGMLLESLNLAAIWKLPVLFICKDNQWAITTPSITVIAGNLAERARGFGMPAIELDGSDVKAVWHAVGEAVETARIGGGPTFLQASCTRFEGHYLGDALLRRAHNPLQEMRPAVVPMLKAVLSRQGAPRRERLDNLRTIASLIQSAKGEQSALDRDPIHRTRQLLASDVDRLEGLESKIVQEIQSIVNCALSTPSAVLQG